VEWESSGDIDLTAQHQPHQGTFAKAELARSTAGAHDNVMEEALPVVSPSAASLALPPIAAAAILSPGRELWSKIFSIVTPLTFLGVVIVMTQPELVGATVIRGGDAAALIGGMAAVLMMLTTLSYGRKGFLDRTAGHVIDGLVFSFKAMGAVLPIAGFFFVGDSSTAGPILGVGAGAHVPSLLFELVQACSQFIPHSPVLVSLGVLLTGIITGIDGSGFAGLPLTGSLSAALAPLAHMPASTLAAIGQMGAVWTGGGTLIAWSSLIAITGFARVPVLEAVRVLFVPVVSGLVIATLVAVAVS
jgi:hypothetical protein